MEQGMKSVYQPYVTDSGPRIGPPFMMRAGKVFADLADANRYKEDFLEICRHTIEGQKLQVNPLMLEYKIQTLEYVP